MYDIRNLNIWKKEPERRSLKSELNDMEISELNLSVRSYNCLKRAGCDTVGQVLAMLEEDENALRRIRNLGSRSEKEILESVEMIKEAYSRQRGSSRIRESSRQSFIIRPAKRIWDARIEQFHLSEETLSRLKRDGVYYVGDLFESDLRQEPGWYAVRELFERILAESPVSVR